MSRTFSTEHTGPDLSETEISKRITAIAQKLGHRTYRMNAGRIKVRGGWIHLNPENTPDRFIKVFGFIVWCEVKKKGKEATADQAAHHDILRSEGDFVLCVDSPEQFEKEFLAVRKICLDRSKRLKESERTEQNEHARNAARLIVGR